MRKIILVTVVLALSACTSQKSAENGDAPAATAQQPAASAAANTSYTEPSFGEPVEPGTDMVPGASNLKKALFAGGCFWCMEPPFDKVDGVVATVSGYAGGSEKDPQYKQVAHGKTSHTEAVLVVYDPDRVGYDKLLDVFWRSHDPTDTKGQFVDRGSQYRPAVFFYDERQHDLAATSREALAASGRFDEPLQTEIVAATTFWPAEEYHQDFYKKDPNHYKRYRSGSGRDQFLDRVWNAD